MKSRGAEQQQPTKHQTQTFIWTQSENESDVEKELNCQKELSSALAKNSFEHFSNAVGYQRWNYRV